MVSSEAIDLIVSEHWGNCTSYHQVYKIIICRELPGLSKEDYYNIQREVVRRYRQQTRF
ncbi:hypothetical protein [Pseudomonas phage LUZ7]|uniref:Uncharacterized protein n=1 Tax=Pseudomonas phage LUZ7 TaxID=655097 RepID=C8ZKE8_9CAUD|nr:hypothetical protein PP-LUZ7_gp028 [Pseudomonas phage LUZ7]CAZ66169.1 hypothetical protein [Pseudomonas phage LUZ7]